MFHGSWFLNLGMFELYIFAGVQRRGTSAIDQEVRQGTFQYEKRFLIEPSF